jgi:hypothetical protein
MEKYLTAQYWFGQPIYPAYGKADQAVFILGLVLTAIGFGLMYYRTVVKDKPKKRLLSRIYNPLITIGLLSVLWFGMRYELIQMFSTRIVVVLIYLVGLIWAYYVWKYYKNVYQREIYMSEQEQQRNRYL